MSALTNLFTAMANKIRSKVGGSDTYTPTQMVSAIDDVYDAGYADATTPITPSDASPAGMTANVGYKPTVNGYAIASNPTALTPSNSSPATISNGTIYKASANGKAVASVTDITPSNSSPVSLAADTPVNPSTAGYAIESYNNVTPSNSSPVALTSGEIDKMGGAGYAIQSYSDITPSNYAPVAMTQGNIYKCAESGYAIERYSDLYPSETGRYFYANTIYKTGNYDGYAVAEITSVTPSDVTPTSFMFGKVYANAGTQKGYISKSKYNAKTGTLTASTTSEEIAIQTGLNNLRNFILHGYSNKTTYQTSMQFFNRWSEDDATFQYIMTKYAANGTVTYQPLSGTAIATAFTIKEVDTTNGIVIIKAPSNANWVDVSLEWFAW